MLTSVRCKPGIRRFVRGRKVVGFDVWWLRSARTANPPGEGVLPPRCLPAPSGPSSAEATHEETLRVVRRFLSEHGASEQEIDRAQMADVLDLLAADRLHVPSEVRYSEDELSERTGMPVELARRFWRALGFPDPTPGDKQFTELDIDAIRLLGTMVEVGFADVESFLQLARVVGSSMARIADAELSTALLSMLSPLSSGRSAESAYRYMCLADQTLPALRDLPRVRVAPALPGSRQARHVPAKSRREHHLARTVCRIRGHGRVHDAQSAALGGGAGFVGGQVRGRGPRRGHLARWAGRQDDR